MSYVSSGKKSSIPSILKKSGRKSIPGRNVRFQLAKDLKSVLLNYESNKNIYLEFVCNIRDSGFDIKDDDILKLLADARDCIPILNENLKLFVQVLLVLKWAHRSDNVVLHYQNFILDICSAYNYYTKFALQQLIQSFLEVKEDTVRNDNNISEEEEQIFNNIHYVIRSLLRIVPMSLNILLEVIKRKFPYKKESPLCHFNYVHNILNITNYAPVLRLDILSLIINKLIHIDVITSKDEIIAAEFSNNSHTTTSEDGDIFMMETDEISELVNGEDMKHVDAKTLDLCLHRIYMYLHDQCYNKNNELKWDKVRSLNQDLTSVFETILLPTHASNHVQFIWFYFVSFKLVIAEGFINFLWNKVINPNVAPVIRQASLCYISGIVARSSYISISVLKNVISNLTSWILKYIETKDCTAERKIPFTRLHGVFYSACHALFYLVSFRHQELFSTPKGIKFVENLNLGRIITCRFDPLNMCPEVTAKNFASVMQTYQLAYCNSVLKVSSISNQLASSLQLNESWPDDFFPFDFYILKRSGNAILPLFREYRKYSIFSDTMKKHNDDDDDNDDDFIHPPASHMSGEFQSSPNFNYSASPGFV